LAAEHLIHHPVVEGLSPAAAFVIGREKMLEKSMKEI